MGLFDLSKELLELIFHHVRYESSTQDFARQICVSKQWEQSFLQVLYRDVILRTSEDIRLFSQIPAHNASLIRSLTLSLSFNSADLQTPTEEQDDVRDRGSNSTRLLWDALRALNQLLTSCTGLTTVSLFVHEPGFGFFLPRQLLAQLVSSLPESCENLEFDTNFSDRDTSEDDDSHLCTAIRSHLPHLIYLRLHLATVCSDLLPGTGEKVKYSNLRMLIVDLLAKDDQSHTTCCKAAKNKDYISTSLNRLHLSGSFPHASHILTIDHQSSTQPGPENGSMEGIWHSYIWRNIRAGHTRSIPYHVLGYDMNLSPVYTARVATSPQRDLVGSRADIRDLAHGRFWQSTYQGSRFPSEVLKMRCALTGDGQVVIPTGLQLDDRESWEKKGNRNMMTLWRWEDISGVECLTGVLQDGVDGPLESILQVVPDRWREIDSGNGLGATGNAIERITRE